MLFEAFCNVSSSWIAFFFFFFFDFLKFFGFHLCLQLDRNLTTKQRQNLSLQSWALWWLQVAQVALRGEYFKMFLLCLSINMKTYLDHLCVFGGSSPSKKKMLNNYFFWKTPGYFSQNVYTAGVWFQLEAVCSQDPGRSGQVWLRLVAGALQESADSSAEEPDRQTGEKLGEGHSVCSPKEKEPN